MSKFVKTKTIIPVEIGEKVYQVDFGSDDITAAIGNVKLNLVKIQSGKYDKMEDVHTDIKNEYKDAVEKVLGDGAVAEISQIDDTISFWDELIMFLDGLSSKVVQDRIEKYSPSRVQRRTK